MKSALRAGLLLAALATPVAVHGQDTEWNRYTLEDLGGIFVRIEVADGCSAAGVAAARYEADLSLKLIEGEVGVLTQAEMLLHPAMPELRVSIDCADGSNGESGALAYSVGLRVQQSAQMMRDTQITLPEAVTWFSTNVGVTSPASAADAVGTALMSSVDDFVTAWTEVHAEGEGGPGF